MFIHRYDRSWLQMLKSFCFLYLNNNNINNNNNNNNENNNSITNNSRN